jgi:hypothetical protein
MSRERFSDLTKRTMSADSLERAALETQFQLGLTEGQQMILKDLAKLPNLTSVTRDGTSFLHRCAMCGHEWHGP